MPILSQIGRRHWKSRVLIAVMYVLLIAGALTMVYPFLLMVAGSTKSAIDAADQEVVPAFLRDDKALYRKHLEGLFNESLNQMRWAYGSEAAMFRDVEWPDSINTNQVNAWREFLASEPLPAYTYELGYLATPQSRNSMPSVLRQFKRLMERKYNDDIDRLNEAMGTTYVGWNSFFVLPRNGLERRGKVGSEALDHEVSEFASSVPLEHRYYFCAEGFYKSAFLKNQYSRDIAEYNRTHGTAYVSWDDVHLERRVPDPERKTELERDDWERFVRGILSLVWIRGDTEAESGYQAFLAAKYGNIVTFNQRYGSHFEGFAQVPFPRVSPSAGVGLSDWEAYLQGWHRPETGELFMIPARYLSLDTVEFRFRDWLQRHERIDDLRLKNEDSALQNSAPKSPIANHHSSLDILPPQRDLHFLAFQAQKQALRREFATRNLRSVIDYVVRHGRAVANTALYCGLAVLCALIFNPLAAYALSRYRPRSTYKILLFMMLTMAFPPMVTQIPVFLMLREFNLLNTFAALILPGLANGYTIFLLKGFFDSLPRELYECAQLDGAGEFRLFWQLTMRLSTPILAVTALGAFTAAYTNFMMALLLCQDERMWTIMPWLYQLQSNSGQGVVFASLLVASLPTLLVFIFCQKIIMRGIVVPVEK